VGFGATSGAIRVVLPVPAADGTDLTNLYAGARKCAPFFVIPAPIRRRLLARYAARENARSVRAARLPPFIPARNKNAPSKDGVQGSMWLLGIIGIAAAMVAVAGCGLQADENGWLWMESVTVR
jgi:hypothetical protein